MSAKPVPCLHCAIIETINAHVVDNGIKAEIGSADAYALHGQITADLMKCIQEHLNLDEMLDDSARRDMWLLISKWASGNLLQFTTLQDLVDSLSTPLPAETVAKH